MNELVEKTELEEAQLQAVIYAKSAEDYAQVAVERGVQALDQAIIAGEYLVKVKQLIGHGNFLPWVEESMPVNQQQCSKYVILYNNRDKLPLGGTINEAVKAIGKAKRGEEPTLEPTFGDAYAKILTLIKKEGSRMEADIYRTLREGRPDSEADYRSLLPDNPNDNPELCIAVAKTIQRFTHPDKGGTEEQSSLANIAFNKLKEDLQ